MPTDEPKLKTVGINGVGLNPKPTLDSTNGAPSRANVSASPSRCYGIAVHHHSTAQDQRVEIPGLGSWPQPRVDPHDPFVALLESHVSALLFRRHVLHQLACVPVIPRALPPHEPRRVPVHLMKRHLPLPTPRRPHLPT